MTPGAVATALLISAMWGLNIVGIKLALAAFPPVWNAFWRMLLGWPVLWLWARAGRVRLMPRRGELWPLGLLGGLFAVQIIVLNFSVLWTSAGFAAVLVSVAPVFINCFAHFFVPGDRLTAGRVAGLAVAFGGVVLVMLADPDPSVAPRPAMGNALGLAVAAMIGGRMVYTQRLVQRIDPVRAIFWQVGFSLPVYLPWAVAAEPLMVGPMTPSALLGWLYCSIGAVGVAFVVWIRLLAVHSPAQLAVFVFPTPVFGVIFSSLIYDEALPAGLVAGVSAVATGILLVTLDRRRAAIAAPDSGHPPLRPG